MTDPSSIDFALDLMGGVPFLPGEAFHAEMDRLRASDPLPTVKFGGATVPLIATYADLDAAFRNDVELPAGPTYKYAIEPCQGVTFESLDGLEHDTLRLLSTGDLHARPVARYVDDKVPAIVHSVIDRFSGRSEVDLVAEFASVVPFAVFADKTGLDAQLDRVADYRDWSFGILSYSVAPDQGLAAAAALTAEIDDALMQCRASPRNDLLSAMCTAERDGRRLTDEEIRSHVRALFAAGASTTFHGLGNTLYALLTHPDAMATLRRDPGAALDAVDEMLRWEPPLAILPRLVPHDATVAGRRLAAGTQLLFGIAAANRDPAVYAEPARFDIARRPTRVLTFGFGSHHCPGAHLARRQIATAVLVLLERMPSLRLIDHENARPSGSIMRGPGSLVVATR